MARSWLDEITERRIEWIRKLAPAPFAPNVAFGFEDVKAVITMMESAVEKAHEDAIAEGRATAMKAAANPFHDYIESPVFAPMAGAMWRTGMTFPMILRRSLMIAICSHVEHVLKQWGGMLHGAWKLSKSPKSFEKQEKDKRVTGDSTLARSVRYLRDEAGLALGSFETWPEWSAIDAYRLVRNALAHAAGAVDDPVQVSKIVALPNVSIDRSGLVSEDDVVNLHPGACEAAAATARDFFDRLTQICNDDPRSARR